MGLSYPQRGTNVPIQQRVTGTNVPEAVTTDEVRNEFADLTSGMSREELAEAAGRSVHAAKKWHAGVQAPDSASMITAARRRPKVRAWLLAKIGGDDARINSPQVLSELHTFLVNVATGEGDEAHEARRLFREIFR